MARLNGTWSNNPVRDSQGGRRGKGRGSGGGGFGGRDDLEATRRYREGGRAESSSYGMVFHLEEDKGSSRKRARDEESRRRSRSRSPSGHRESRRRDGDYWHGSSDRDRDRDRFDRRDRRR